MRQLTARAEDCDESLEISGERGIPGTEYKNEYKRSSKDAQGRLGTLEDES